MPCAVGPSDLTGYAVKPLQNFFLLSALLASAGAAAAADGNMDLVRDLTGHVGPVVGSALACRDIAPPRIQVIVDKFTAVIKEVSSSEAERSELMQLLDRHVADGRSAVTTGRIDCRMADRQLSDLERSIAGTAPNPAPPPPSITSSFAASAATMPTHSLPNCRRENRLHLDLTSMAACITWPKPSELFTSSCRVRPASATHLTTSRR